MTDNSIAIESYLLLSDVTVTEEVVEIENFGVSSQVIDYSWTATFEGRPVGSDNSELEMAQFEFHRTGKTAADAMYKLIDAAKEQGWVFI